MNRLIGQIPELTEVEYYHDHDGEILPSYLIAGRIGNIAVTFGIFSQNPENKPPQIDDLLDDEDLCGDSLEGEIEEHFDLNLFEEEDLNFVHEDDFKRVVSHEVQDVDYIWAKAMIKYKKGTHEEYWYFGKLDQRLRENVVLSLIYDTPNSINPLLDKERIIRFAYDTNPIDIITTLCTHARNISKRIKERVIPNESKR